MHVYPTDNSYAQRSCMCKIIMILVYQTGKSPAAEFSWIEKLTKSTRSLASAGKDAQDAVDSVS